MFFCAGMLNEWMVSHQVRMVLLTSIPDQVGTRCLNWRRYGIVLTFWQYNSKDKNLERTTLRKRSRKTNFDIVTALI